MGLAFIIIIRILFAVCMIFIIGYIFGGFSRKPILVTWSKVAAILVIVLFIAVNILLMRFAFGHGCHRYQQQQEINRHAY
jgi:membrane protein YdbS with pleckstrin-like domain